MDQRDSVGLVLAFAVGAILGVGATLLLRPEPTLPRRIARRLGASGKHLTRSARHAAHGGGAKLASAGREALDRFRGEVAEVVSVAREQLAQDVHEQLHGGRRGERRAWRRGRR